MLRVTKFAIKIFEYCTVEIYNWPPATSNLKLRFGTCVYGIAVLLLMQSVLSYRQIPSMFLVDFYGFDHSNIPILGQITNFVSSNMYLFLYLLSVWNDHGRIICGILLFFKFTLVSLCTALSNTCVSCRDLGNSNLSGNLVPELGHLEHLQYLWVWQNIIALSFFFCFA